MIAVTALSACGSVSPGPQEDPSRDPGPALDEVVAQGIIMQSSPDARVEVCIGPVATSYPPQCGGPGLLGQFSWADVESREQSGVRWSDASYFAVGTYDREADTFTLTQPLSTEPPAGFAVPTHENVQFPQLCDDPFRGADPARTADVAAQDRLQQRLALIDGYVTSWVSDGVDLFNVIVIGDAEAAHATLREVWDGGLCVEHRDLPTAAASAAAQAALNERSEELGLSVSGIGGVSGVLEVEVVLADAETTTLIHDIVSPWLGPDEMHITSAIVPLRARG